MDSPKLFISYSWSSPEHELRVLKLATELRENGVDVILDKWDLKEGQDADAFMEKMVTDESVKKVVMLCDKAYAEKANGRKGGVGTEAQIISREIYEGIAQSKFVAVVIEKDDNGKPYLPAYYQSRIYVDLSDNNIYSKNFDQLLRWVYDKPFYEKPDIGKSPSFLDATKVVSLRTTTAFRKLINAIKNGEEQAGGALGEYFDIFVVNLENFRIIRKEEEFDDLVVENIKSFRSYRDEVVEVFLAIAQYRHVEDSYIQIHRFFEGTIPYLSRPDGVTAWSEWDFDNFKFIVHELFLCCIASLIKKGAIDGVTFLLSQEYFFDDPNKYDNGMKRFAVLNNHLSSIERRNTRLNLRRLSLHADLIKERASDIPGINFKDIMQADFLLFLRDSLDKFNQGETSKDWDRWFPLTLVYAEYRGRPFEIFARAQQKEYFDKLIRMLGVQNKISIDQLVERFRSGKILIPSFGGGWGTFDPVSLMNYNLLATT